MIQVEGKKIILREITQKDAAEEYLGWLNDDEVTKGLDTIVKPYPLDMLKAYVADAIASKVTHMFIIVDKETSDNIGTAKIHSISEKNGTCNLGMMIGNKKYWGKGYGQDAYNTAIDYAFTRLQIRKIWELANADNYASLSMCKKAGFQIEGQLKEQVLSEGKYIDKVLLGLFARDWKK